MHTAYSQSWFGETLRPFSFYLLLLPAVQAEFDIRLLHVLLEGGIVY
jgi:hypothetical protein